MLQNKHMQYFTKEELIKIYKNGSFNIEIFLKICENYELKMKLEKIYQRKMKKSLMRWD